MSYANTAALSANPSFIARNRACVTEQALIFKDDGRADIAALAHAVIVDGPTVAANMLPLVCGAPGFGDVTDQSEIDDAMLLSAVQAVWPTYAAAAYPAA